MNGKKTGKYLVDKSISFPVRHLQSSSQIGQTSKITYPFRGIGVNLDPSFLDDTVEPYLSDTTVIEGGRERKHS